MKRSIIAALLLLASLSYGQSIWPAWRGPAGNGMAPDGCNPPLEWGENKNVKWTFEDPGKGLSTPIIWEDKLFLLTAVDTGRKGKAAEAQSEQRGGRMPSNKANTILSFEVLCLNRNNGQLIWKTSVIEEMPADATHGSGTWASNSPVTDGKNLYAYFGSRGLYSLDMKGNVIWSRDFGQMSKRMEFGEGSSPVLYKDRLIITWDHEGDSFLYVVDAKTGKDVWNVPRDERTSWSTPVVIRHEGRDQVIVSATTRVRSYDLENGEVIWEIGGLTENVIPMPVFNNKLVYVTSGFRGAALMAIDITNAKGDITGSDAVVWTYNQDTPYVPSPLLNEGRLYFLRSNTGAVTCVNALTGEPYYSKERLENMGTVYASPVGWDKYICFAGEKGDTVILEQGSEFKVAARNTLNDGFHASPAIVGNTLYLRGFERLYCIQKTVDG